MNESMIVAAIDRLSMEVSSNTKAQYTLAGKFEQFSEGCKEKHVIYDKVLVDAIKRSEADRDDIRKRLVHVETVTAVTEGREVAVDKAIEKYV